MVGGAMLKLDLGCGKNKTTSIDEHPFIGIDQISFDGVDYVMDFRANTWCCHSFPVPEWGQYFDETEPELGWHIVDSSVDEVYCAHVIEHLTGEERITFFNELYRILKPSAKALIIAPDWSNARAYGDPTHKWPPVSSWFMLYLNKEWRDINAPHVGYTGDFDWINGLSWDPWISTRNDEFKQFATAISPALQSPE